MENKEEKVSTGKALLAAKAAYDESADAAMSHPLGEPDEQPVVAAEESVPMNYKELEAKLLNKSIK